MPGPAGRHRDTWHAHQAPASSFILRTALIVAPCRQLPPFRRTHSNAASRQLNTGRSPGRLADTANRCLLPSRSPQGTLDETPSTTNAGRKADAVGARELVKLLKQTMNALVSH
jgi:hypothetical protein